MMKFGRRVAAWGTVFATSFAIARSAHALGQSSNIQLTDPLGGNESFSSVATGVSQFLFWDIASPLAIVMVLVGAFQLITSSGDPEKVSKGRKTILYAAIGFVCALIAGGIVQIIQNFVNNLPSQ